MPVDRDKEGKVRVIPTDLLDDTEDRPTVLTKRYKTENKETPLMNSPDDESMPNNPADSGTPDSEMENKKTKIIIGNPVVEDLVKTNRPDSDNQVASSPDNQPVKTEDFATAALVIIKGLGIGKIATMGMGMNTIGRDSSQRVCLNFGDNTISRENHCRLVYDGREKEYLITVGGSANLVYLNNKRVIEPQILKHGDIIEIGETLLRFIPFCDDSFDWNK